MVLWTLTDGDVAPGAEDMVDEILRRLNTKLGPDFFQYRNGPGGKLVQYLSGDEAISLANWSLGNHRWSSELRDMQVRETTLDGSNWKVSVSTKCRVTVRWSADHTSFHEDVGRGSGINPQQGAAMESAEKEAATDALKRALRLFGDGLGNSMYILAYRDWVKSNRHPGRPKKYCNWASTPKITKENGEIVFPPRKRPRNSDVSTNDVNGSNPVKVEPSLVADSGFASDDFDTDLIVSDDDERRPRKRARFAQ